MSDIRKSPPQSLSVAWLTDGIFNFFITNPSPGRRVGHGRVKSRSHFLFRKNRISLSDFIVFKKIRYLPILHDNRMI